MTGPINALTQAFVQIVNFKGRATRSEFWWAFGLFALIGVGAGVADAVMVAGLIETSGEEALLSLRPLDFSIVFVGAVLFLPLISLSVRRLHDGGYSGMWQLIMVLPFVGTLILLVMYILPTRQETTVYGSPRVAPATSQPGHGKVKTEDAHARAMKGYALLFDQDKKVTPEMAAARKAEISDYYKTRVLKPAAEV